MNTETKELPDIKEHTNNVNRVIREQIDKSLAKELKKIPNYVQEMVQGALLSIFGLEKNYSGYSVKSWSGDKSPIATYINQKAKECVNEIVGPLLVKELTRISKLKTFERNVLEQITAAEVEREFNRVVKRRLGDSIENAAEAYVQKVGETVNKVVEESVDINTDIFNPKSYSGMVGEVLLEQAAKEQAELSDMEEDSRR